MNQKFTVQLEVHYKNDTDATILTEIDNIYTNLETVTADATKKNLGIGCAINIPEFSYSAPEIDHVNHTLKVIATYTILYRMES